MPNRCCIERLEERAEEFSDLRPTGLVPVARGPPWSRTASKNPPTKRADRSEDQIAFHGDLCVDSMHQETRPPSTNRASVTRHDPLLQRPGRRQFQIQSGWSQGPRAFRSLRCNLRSVGKAGVKQAGSPSCSPSAPPQARSSSPESESTPIEWSIAPPTANNDSNTATHCSSSRSVDGGQLGRLRTIIVVVDQLSRAALQATSSIHRSGSSKGSIARPDVGLQGKGCDHVGVFTPHREPVDD